jgi:hypothetical protein
MPFLLDIGIDESDKPLTLNSHVLERVKAREKLVSGGWSVI